ncbi:MAG: cell division protein DivIC [Bacteroidota bacterium]|nr:cell division protein DivIC [Bacteroidota bacterium]
MIQFFNKKSILGLLKNRYVWVLLFFCFWMLFLDNCSYFDHLLLDRQIAELEENKVYYQEEIKKDEGQIKMLQNNQQIEKYAREKYFMKKENEDIFIIEFEGDTLVENDSTQEK